MADGVPGWWTPWLRASGFGGDGRERRDDMRRAGSRSGAVWDGLGAHVVANQEPPPRARLVRFLLHLMHVHQETVAPDAPAPTTTLPHRCTCTPHHTPPLTHQQLVVEDAHHRPQRRGGVPCGRAAQLVHVRHRRAQLLTQRHQRRRQGLKGGWKGRGGTGRALSHLDMIFCIAARIDRKRRLLPIALCPHLDLTLAILPGVQPVQQRCVLVSLHEPRSSATIATRTANLSSPPPLTSARAYSLSRSRASSSSSPRSAATSRSASPSMDTSASCTSCGRECGCGCGWACGLTRVMTCHVMGCRRQTVGLTLVAYPRGWTTVKRR